MRYLLALLVIFSLASCAKIVPPDGGPKDTAPPEVVAMVPGALTTNFNSANVYIEFNEYVRLNDIYNQLVVSPPLKKRPVITLKGKAVTIEFEEELERDVTYSLQFGEGIVDLNEGNPAKGLQYVFSTGDQLDSLVVRGRAYDLVSGEPLEGAKIMLYSNFADSMPLTSKPSYFGLSGPDGKFELNYLASGDYRLFALKEENFNYLYDDFSELIGFRTDTLQPSTPLDTAQFIEVPLSKEPDTLQYLVTYDADSTGLIRAQLFHEPENTRASFKLDLINEDIFRGHVVRMNDSLFAWHDLPNDGEQLQWVFSSPSANDTIEVEVFNYQVRKLRSRNLPPQSLAREDTLRWSFARPIARADTSLISFYRDSIPVNGTATLVPGSFDVFFDMELSDGGNYAIELLPGAIESREGYRNDTLRWAFSTWKTDYFGKVIVKVLRKVPESALLQLLDKNGVVRQKMVSSGEVVVFDRLLPSTYSLRVLNDENQNGKWDPSNYSESRRAEQLEHFMSTVQVRSNWEMELEW